MVNEIEDLERMVQNEGYVAIRLAQEKVLGANLVSHHDRNYGMGHS